MLPRPASAAWSTRDAFTMLEGVLEVADLQVRDIMVPRAQMVCVRRDEPVARILPAVVESRPLALPGDG